jgi:hypothetical protein
MRVAAALLVLLIAPVALAQKPEPTIPTLPVVISIATEEGPSGPRPVQQGAWIDDQLGRAERLFGTHGVHFVEKPRRALAARHAQLETRADRDALAAELVPGVINVFVVGSLRDVDDPSRMRMGVHWRFRKQLAKHYVIVAASAMPTTLAHELGHFFGNGHSKVVNNVMSYERTDDAEVFFDAGQVRKIKALARTYVRTRELLPD